MTQLTIRNPYQHEKPAPGEKARPVRAPGTRLFSIDILHPLKALKLHHAQEMGHRIEARWNAKRNRIDLVALALLAFLAGCTDQPSAPAPVVDHEASVIAFTDSLNFALRRMFASGKRGVVTIFVLDTNVAPTYVYLPRR